MQHSERNEPFTKHETGPLVSQKLRSYEEEQTILVRTPNMSFLFMVQIHI